MYRDRRHFIKSIVHKELILTLTPIKIYFITVVSQFLMYRFLINRYLTKLLY